MFFMLNSTEHDFFLLINVKMPTVVGILTLMLINVKIFLLLMSRKNSILELSEPEISDFLIFFILMSI